MSALAVHLASVVLARAGRLSAADAADPAAVQRQADHAEAAAFADVARVAAETKARHVFAVLPAKGSPFRASLARGWSREQDEGGATERPAALWAALDRVAERLRDQGAVVLVPRPFPVAHMLDLGGGEAAPVGGHVPSSRDAIAVLAAEHRQRGDGSTLRVMSSRTSCAALLDPHAGIAAVLLEGDAWKHVTEPGDLAAWKKWPGTEALRVPRALLADYEALLSLPGIGETFALALLRTADGKGAKWRGLLEAVAAAEAGEVKRKGLADTLRELGQRGARELLAVHGLRADVDVDELEAPGARRPSADEVRLAKLAATPIPPAEHGPGVVVTRSDGQREAAHTDGADERRPTPREEPTVIEAPPASVAAPAPAPAPAATPPAPPAPEAREAILPPAPAAPPEAAPVATAPAPAPKPRSDIDAATRSMPASIAAALIHAQGEIRRVAKEGNNTFAHYRYATADDVIDEARLCLHAGGLGLLHTWTFAADASGPDGAAVRERAQGKGPTLSGTIGRVTLKCRLFHLTGASIVVETSLPVVIEAGKAADKSELAAVTACLAYTLRGLLLIPRGDEKGTGVDDRDERRAS